MDIFDTTTLNMAEQEARNLASKNRAGLDLVKHSFTEAFNALWNNQNATPQEILDVYSNNAYKLFQVARDTIAFIKTLDPKYQEPVPPYLYTINNDGTVTVGENITQ